MFNVNEVAGILSTNRQEIHRQVHKHGLEIRTCQCGKRSMLFTKRDVEKLRKILDDTPKRRRRNAR
jgi:hypothetical protein